MHRLLLSRLTLRLLVLAAIGGGAACQTSDLTQRSMAAKAASSTCDQQALNSRRDCEDLPGCYWNNEVGHCTAP